jgi:hypothetical protein
MRLEAMPAQVVSYQFGCPNHCSKPPESKISMSAPAEWQLVFSMLRARKMHRQIRTKDPWNRAQTNALKIKETLNPIK